MLSLIHRNEFRAWTDIKPVKPIKAKPQYKPPDDKMAHETSYSAQFKGEANKPTPADNKVIDRRRIRSLYSEPFKEPPKVRQILWGNPSAQPRTEGLIAAEREGRAPADPGPVPKGSWKIPPLLRSTQALRNLC